MGKEEEGSGRGQYQGTVACLLKAGIVKPAETAVARKRLYEQSKNTSTVKSKSKLLYDRRPVGQ
jgi:hypothetical protein